MGLNETIKDSRMMSVRNRFPEVRYFIFLSINFPNTCTNSMALPAITGLEPPCNGILENRSGYSCYGISMLAFNDHHYTPINLFLNINIP